MVDLRIGGDMSGDETGGVSGTGGLVKEMAGFGVGVVVGAVMAEVLGGGMSGGYGGG